jgi:hypothetical protein
VACNNFSGIAKIVVDRLKTCRIRAPFDMVVVMRKRYIFIFSLESYVAKIWIKIKNCSLLIICTTFQIFIKYYRRDILNLTISWLGYNYNDPCYFGSHVRVRSLISTNVGTFRLSVRRFKKKIFNFFFKFDSFMG